jgi:hypothetical protein
MLPRREFMTGSTVVLLMTPVVAACGGDDDADDSPSNVCDGAGANSSTVSGHSHFVCVAASALMSPPAGGVTYQTTLSDGHIHEVALSADDLTAIGGNDTVTITTSMEDGHTHEFMLRRSSSGAGSGPGPNY